MEPKIILIDASSLKISGCKLHFSLVVLDGYRKELQFNDVEFGSAFHACAKEVGAGKSLNEGLLQALIYWQSTKMEIKPDKEYLNAIFLDKVCRGWYNSDLFEKDDWEIVKDLKGNPLVEYRFFRPYFKDEGYEVLFVGTMDKICVHRSIKTMLAVGDYKTTSVWNEQKFFNQYKLDCQLLFYGNILKEDVENSKEGDILYPFQNKDIHLFIDGIFLKGADKPVTYKRSPLYKLDLERLQVFNRMLLSQVKELIYTLKSGSTFDPTGIVNGSCNTKFGPCEFFNYCAAHPSQKQEILKREFVQKPYDPSKFGELVPTTL